MFNEKLHAQSNLYGLLVDPQFRDIKIHVPMNYAGYSKYFFSQMQTQIEEEQPSYGNFYTL